MMPRYSSHSITRTVALLVLGSIVPTGCSSGVDRSSATRDPAPSAAAVMSSPLLSGSEAAAMILSTPDLLVVDAGPPNLYAERRIRGATHADYGLWLDRTERDPIDPEFIDAWRRDLASDGVGEATSVIIYGRPGSYSAPATTWYGLQSIGVERVWVVNGGFEAIAEHLPDAWIERGPRDGSLVGPPVPTGAAELVDARRPGDLGHVIDSADAINLGDAIESGDAINVGVLNEPHAQDVHDERGGSHAANRTPAFLPVRIAARCPLAMKRDVVAALTDGRTRFIDARRPAEFTGQETRGNPRPGRIPGAIHLEHTALLDVDGRFLPPSEIRRALAELGVDTDDPLIVYCQSGGRSAALALALTDAGFTSVRNSFGSFREWSADESCPVESEPVQKEAPQ